ncbi:putative Type VI secretion system, VCA0110 [Vibrio nigripulchritudo MADA3029]|uniref:type VI secretion system baseplate subunit TssF n=1 Tax=Vibrio nigripulchritudo TaxID=28173 RepID=UPI0003B1BA0E|nr:type VI secretion system baseplate subunit TssF [Vibrio nigripulchritudo]CCN45815.1 putative Type VI secretion system, VCA0110 [Vibrio nigripulchritudo MADA3020]CCN53729.1 putative Type VI secretion system, VCA0110 [Vibrio nigripulchritudo MADA3021]CCN58675.1 putative Type VI secretion system, VCA0110 [Vibrio nigripulchritudo MADA3029]
MAQDKYFRDELAFLKDQGKQFTEIHPQLSRFLNGRNTDPDVERLLEGFAFLTGKLREKVEDEFPELTHSIINMLWPNYLRPIPSMSILRFSPKGNFSTRQVIKKQTKVDSVPVFDTPCQFRTCRDVEIYPIVCDRISAIHTKDASKVSLEMSMLNKDESIGSVELDSLRFYLGGDTYSAQNLYLWLGHYLDSIEVEYDGGSVKVPTDVFDVVGFDNDGLLPYPKNVYQGYRIFQEYLAFPESFHFFDLKHIGRYISDHVTGKFTLRFHFTQTLPGSTLVSDESFILYATPIVNLFRHDADPIDLTGKRTEYRIAPSSRYPRHYEIFSVDHVEGWQETSDGRVRGQRRVYTPFESFQHEIELARQRLALYYRVRVKDSIRKDGFDHHISFVRGDETTGYLLDEAVTLELTCTNRQLPAELAVGDICVSTDTSPPFADFENITIPTQTLRPVLDGSLLWTLISNLSLNYLSLLDKNALCSVLRAYDFRSLVDQQAARISRQRMDGIVSIESEPLDKLIKGMPVRGLLSRITMDPNAFGSEGDLYLFGTVLSQFFALYASINSFHELVVVNAESREEYSWGNQHGMQPLI